MNADWRVQVDFVEEGVADALHDRLAAAELEHDLSRTFSDRVVVARNGTTIFLYAGDRSQAENAQALVERLAREQGEDVEVSFDRWHHEAEEWRPADEPLPADAEAQAAEHAARVACERAESEASGYPEYEVRIDLPSHGEAKELVERLSAEALPSVHRWKYVLLGAADEDSANELAEQVRAEVPPGSKITVEGTWREAYAKRSHSPFSFLGGLVE
ncbi:MAG TPA: hypothetical protein VG448_14175 [Solirubrobacterales bacterium]|nr:hypothetical protein [Solirubrobacterales bacterium]